MTGLLHRINPRLPSLRPLKHQCIKSNSSLISLRCDIDGSLPVLLNSPEEDTTSLINGRLLLDVNSAAVEVKDLNITLRVHITHKRPFKKGCKSCQRYTLESKAHRAVTTSAILQRGTHGFPFIFEVGSYVPPSTNNSLIAVTYELHADACIVPEGQPRTIPHIYTYKREIPVARTISVPTSPTYSRRIFKSAGSEIACRYNPVINLPGTNKVSLTLSGLLGYPEHGEVIHVWKLLKGSWWLEENIRTKAVACGRYSLTKVEKSCQGGRDRTKTNILGEGGIYDGWDQTANTDTIDLDFEYSIKKSKPYSASYNPESSDMGETALSVSHSLVIELVLIKEDYPKDGSASATRTGIARILRSKQDIFIGDYTRPSVLRQEEELPCYDGTTMGPPDYNE
ncbi:hypothetical protein FSARC_9656 [Fusarium sarcochroum]|uniref:LDB19 N-terminal domain-containing protein n=1 Tax=Fusarium sarcochroum TaxID=1208366 RepID=A0A8H4X532_9HYPO|nr:hypothetical protein FSARC_9656 [Fusarium sarcochroum]